MQRTAFYCKFCICCVQWNKTHNASNTKRSIISCIHFWTSIWSTTALLQKFTWTFWLKFFSSKIGTFPCCFIAANKFIPLYLQFPSKNHRRHAEQSFNRRAKCGCRKSLWRWQRRHRIQSADAIICAEIFYHFQHNCVDKIGWGQWTDRTICCVANASRALGNAIECLAFDFAEFEWSRDQFKRLRHNRIGFCRICQRRQCTDCWRAQNAAVDWSTIFSDCQSTEFAFVC